MSEALRAGVVYFVVVFATGFLLGTIRVLAIIPQVGETAAVLLELPVMLAFSWATCVWLVRRFAVPPRTSDRVVMGGLAFLFLMIAEVGVSVFAFGRTFAEHLQTFRTTDAQLGLAGQVLFAGFPLIQMVRRRQ